jgi:hypothetical protein
MYKRATLASLIIIFLSMITFLPTITPTAQPSSKPPTRTPQPTSPTPTAQANCYKPLAVTSEIDGYAEGTIGGKSAIMTGKEITYNFATFQRKIFSSKLDATNAPHNAGLYVSTIDGFVTNPGDPTDFTTFHEQYDLFGGVQIQMVTNSLSASEPIWSGWTSLPGRKGTVHYATASDQIPYPAPISGDQAFLQLDRGTMFTPGVNVRMGYFAAAGQFKSYIVNCLVDINALITDIRSGDSSPASFSVSVAAWRDAAADAAQMAAQDYNRRVLAGEG